MDAIIATMVLHEKPQDQAMAWMCTNHDQLKKHGENSQRRVGTQWILQEYFGWHKTLE